MNCLHRLEVFDVGIPPKDKFVHCVSCGEVWQRTIQTIRGSKN